MLNDPVVQALRAALAATDSADVRAALSERLVTLGDTEAALGEAEEGLKRYPTSAPLLAVAARAALATDHADRAAAYELALRAQTRAGDGGATAERLSAGDPRRLRVVREEEQSVVPTLTLADVAGLEDVKVRLHRSFLDPLRDPELYRRFGKRPGGGLLLYGAPGCGKTYLARALAGELGARFTAVGLTDVLDMWLGSSEQRLHSLFENARRQAPVVLFFDEIDALGHRRANLRGAAARNVVNQLLAEMDGTEGSNEGLFFLAATNHPWDVDAALRRPGRLDRLVFVPPPDEAARLDILSMSLAGRPLAAGTALGSVARTTAGFSGADLVAMVDLATDLAIEATRREGRDRAIDGAMLARAVAETRPSTRAWFEQARHHAIYANEGGAYDDLVEVLRRMKLA